MQDYHHKFSYTPATVDMIYLCKIDHQTQCGKYDENMVCTSKYVLPVRYFLNATMACLH